MANTFKSAGLSNVTANTTIYTSQIVNNATNNISIILPDGLYLWGISCFDNTTWHSYNISVNRTIRSEEHTSELQSH